MISISIMVFLKFLIMPKATNTGAISFLLSMKPHMVLPISRGKL